MEETLPGGNILFREGEFQYLTQDSTENMKVFHRLIPPNAASIKMTEEKTQETVTLSEDSTLKCHRNHPQHICL